MSHICLVKYLFILGSRHQRDKIILYVNIGCKFSASVFMLTNNYQKTVVAVTEGVYSLKHLPGRSLI